MSKFLGEETVGVGGGEALIDEAVGEMTEFVRGGSIVSLSKKLV